MIALPRFDFLSPSSIEEAVSTTSLPNAGMAILAGGTDLLVNIKHGLRKPNRVVWLGKVPELRTISFSPELGLRMGAMCTLGEIAASPTIQQSYPAIAKAARSIASPSIRNSATLGGNLCQDTRCFYYNQSEFWRGALGGCLKARVPSASNGSICHATPGLASCTAVFCSDTAPLLIALGAAVRLKNHRGERHIGLADLYRDDGVNHLTLEPGEIIAEVFIPPPEPYQFSAFKKLRDRRSIDFALANVGVSIVLDSSLVCSAARIVVGAVQSAPVVCSTAESMLVVNELTTALIHRAAHQAALSVRPVPNVEEPVGYRKKMVAVIVERALLEVWSKASGQRSS